ncbi:hypothetical protein ACWXWU_12455 [Shewanella sp. A14]
MHLIVTLTLLFSISVKAEDRCKRIELNSSVTLEKSRDHCIVLPIYTSKPIVISQYEAHGGASDEFKVQLVESIRIGARVEETFSSNGPVTTHRSFKASQRGEAVLHISPSTSNRKTKTDVIYGRVEGVDILFLINTNTVYRPITPPSRPPVDECQGRNCNNINMLILEPLDTKSKPSILSMKSNTNYPVSLSINSVNSAANLDLH